MDGGRRASSLATSQRAAGVVAEVCAGVLRLDGLAVHEEARRCAPRSCRPAGRRALHELARAGGRGAGPAGWMPRPSLPTVNTTTSPRCGLAQPRQFANRVNGMLDAVDELVHEQVVADQQRREHRARRDAVGLDHEGADRERQRDRHRERAELIPELAQRRRRRAPALAAALAAPACAVPRRSFVAQPQRREEGLLRDLDRARRASCAACPSFCFSSSLRLREMSPP